MPATGDHLNALPSQKLRPSRWLASDSSPSSRMVLSTVCGGARALEGSQARGGANASPSVGTPAACEPARIQINAWAKHSERVQRGSEPCCSCGIFLGSGRLGQQFGSKETLRSRSEPHEADTDKILGIGNRPNGASINESGKFSSDGIVRAYSVSDRARKPRSAGVPCVGGCVLKIVVHSDGHRFVVCGGRSSCSD